MMADPSQHAPTYPVNARGRLYDPAVTDDERTWAMLAHLSVLAHLIAPVVALAAPLVIWLVKREQSAYLDDHARESLNFHITLVLYSVLAIPLAIITCGIGGLLLLLVYPLGLIGMIMASIAANRGEFYRYPMTFRFIN